MTGATRYAADEPDAGILHARLVLSPYAHARIVGVDGSAALAIPGVVAVLTGADMPIASTKDRRMDEPLARGEAVFAGQPVAMVVAVSEELAQDGADRVLVDYEPLPVVLDPIAAMDPLSPLARPRRRPVEEGSMSAHAAVGGESEDPATWDESRSANVSGRIRYASGDVEAAMANVDATVSGRFSTSWVHQGYVEPMAATAAFERDGTLVVRTATQGIFFSRTKLAEVFGLPVDRIRVEGSPLGGAFGAKSMVVEPLAVGAALAVGRGVRVVLTRREDFAMTNPAQSSTIELEIGGGRDRGLTVIRGRIVMDAGAYGEWSAEEIAAILAGGVYRWDAWDVRAFAVETNRVGVGAYRGPGAPQAHFALEQLVDELAERLDVDPVDLRLVSLAAPGEPMLDDEAWQAIGVAECLHAARAHPLWQTRGHLPAHEGVGIAAGYWPGGNEPAAALCRLDPDGGITVITGSVDMTGTDTGFATIAAATFGVPIDMVRVAFADTATAPQAPMSGGSVVTYSVGSAVRRAAEDARDQLLAIAAVEMEIEAADLEIVDGVVRPKGSPDRGVPVRRFAKRQYDWGFEYAPVSGHGGHRPPGLAPSAAVHLVHVRVDPETGAVVPLRHVIAQDVGRALNPALVEGQMAGGAAQAIGWALHEALRFDEGGQLLTGSFLDYSLPGATDVPAIETIIVEVPAPDGPFGARGIGEAPVVAGPAAIANAIGAATGVRLRDLPMTSDRVWRALRSPAS